MFHIHIGYNNPNVETSLSLIKYLDAYVGVPSVLMDGDTNRRNLYGKAGAFRLTDYGVEWRCLSSFFLRTKTNLNFVWDGVQRAINAFNNGIPLPDPEEVQEAINTSNIELANKLIDKYKLKNEILPKRLVFPKNKDIILDQEFHDEQEGVQLREAIHRVDEIAWDIAIDKENIIEGRN